MLIYFEGPQSNFSCVSLVQLVIDDSVAVTPFYLLLDKHRQQQQKLNTLSHPAADKPQQKQGSVSIKQVSRAGSLVII